MTSHSTSTNNPDAEAIPAGTPSTVTVSSVKTSMEIKALETYTKKLAATLSATFDAKLTAAIAAIPTPPPASRAPEFKHNSSSSSSSSSFSSKRPSVQNSKSSSSSPSTVLCDHSELNDKINTLTQENIELKSSLSSMEARLNALESSLTPINVEALTEASSVAPELLALKPLLDIPSEITSELLPAIVAAAPDIQATLSKVAAAETSLSHLSQAGPALEALSAVPVPTLTTFAEASSALSTLSSIASPLLSSPLLAQSLSSIAALPTDSLAALDSLPGALEAIKQHPSLQADLEALTSAKTLLVQTRDVLPQLENLHTSVQGLAPVIENLPALKTASASATSIAGQATMLKAHAPILDSLKALNIPAETIATLLNQVGSLTAPLMAAANLIPHVEDLRFLSPHIGTLKSIVARAETLNKAMQSIDIAAPGMIRIQKILEDLDRKFPNSSFEDAMATVSSLTQHKDSIAAIEPLLETAAAARESLAATKSMIDAHMMATENRGQQPGVAGSQLSPEFMEEVNIIASAIPVIQSVLGRMNDADAKAAQLDHFVTEWESQKESLLASLSTHKASLSQATDATEQHHRTFLLATQELRAARASLEATGTASPEALAAITASVDAVAQAKDIHLCLTRQLEELNDLMEILVTKVDEEDVDYDEQTVALAASAARLKDQTAARLASTSAQIDALTAATQEQHRQ